MNKIKQNDEVIVIAGKDKGSVGTETKGMGSMLIVEGFNIVKKHEKTVLFIKKPVAASSA